MAVKPRMTVRLSPSYEHMLRWMAERQGAAPAEMARVTLQAQLERLLEQKVWRAQWQDAYNAELNARAAEREAATAGQILRGASPYSVHL
jgi:hypothetical protein